MLPVIGRQEGRSAARLRRASEAEEMSEPGESSSASGKSPEPRGGRIRQQRRSSELGGRLISLDTRVVYSSVDLDLRGPAFKDAMREAEAHFEPPEKESWLIVAATFSEMESMLPA